MEKEIFFVRIPNKGYKSFKVENLDSKLVEKSISCAKFEVCD